METFSLKKLRKRLHKWRSDNLSFTKAKDYQNGTKRNKINPKKLSLILEKFYSQTIKMFCLAYKNLRSVIRNRHSVIRNGRFKVRNAHSVSRNGDLSTRDKTNS